jgi:hypothetical protein
MTDASTLFELLAAPERRRVLFALCDAERIEVPDDVRNRQTVELAAGHDEGRERRRTGDPEQLTVQLYHRHLPKLAAADVVEWDRESGTVTRGAAFADVEPSLSLVTENADAFPDDLN